MVVLKNTMQNEAYMTPIQGKIEKWNSGFIKLLKYCKPATSQKEDGFP